MVTLINKKFWKGKKILITGHSGFKGGWLSCLLDYFQSEIYGLSLPDYHSDGIYKLAASKARLEKEFFVDIRDLDLVRSVVDRVQPDIIIHMAAQPLVRKSYREPLDTLDINIMGTANLLECARDIANLQSILVITTDKVYKNKNNIWPFREIEELGASDPYSTSKACVELVCDSYYYSFFKINSIGLSTVRTGNVIGGGDVAEDRLVPDILRAIQNQGMLSIRMPDAIRPWQHVIEPLIGYLMVIEKMADDLEKFSSSYNFGPDSGKVETVRSLLDLMSARTGFKTWKEDYGNLKEADILKLDNTKAQIMLDWKPIMSLRDTVDLICEWNEAKLAGADMYGFTIKQIKKYLSLIRTE